MPVEGTRDHRHLSLRARAGGAPDIGAYFATLGNVVRAQATPGAVAVEPAIGGIAGVEVDPER